MAEDRLPVVREMIMAADEAERRSALDRLLPMQQADFEGIFEAMAGLPVTIRLLDPPLHEFLPPIEEATDERMRARIEALHEANPMLGTRGCRLGLEWPEIYEMQVRAIVRAASAVQRAHRRGAAGRDHAPARRLRRGARAAARAHGAHRRRGGRDRLPVRDDDRAAAGLRPGRRDRRARGLLLLRHERPDADGARLLARRRRGEVPHALPRRPHPRPRPVRDARPERRRRPDADRGRARRAASSRSCGSGSAASTAAIPRRSRSATGSGSTTCPARPTACRSPGSPPLRRRWPRRASASTSRPAAERRIAA